MPSERFYRLPEEKKIIIRQAIIKEYARVPIDKVSINKIIKAADISRGSFYTYFEDKWDILAYIFTDGQESMKSFCVENLNKNNGNIWKMLMDFLENAMDFCVNNGTFEFIRNVMEHSRSEDMFNSFSSKMNRCGEPDELELWIFEKADKSDFRHQGFKEFHCFLTVVMPLMGTAMREFYLGSSKEQVMGEFKKKLELIRYGVCSC